MILLSILIITTPDREVMLNNLLAALDDQLYQEHQPVEIRENMGDFTYRAILYAEHLVEIKILDSPKEDVSPSFNKGFKRNLLVKSAQGKYLGHFDSDDRPGPNYIKHAMQGIAMNVDCCGLTGIITENGANPKKFIHSLQYDSWFEKDNIYFRNPNHLNIVRSSVAKQMNFPEVNQGEDHSYSKQLHESGLLKSEYWDRDEVIYHYDYISKK